MRKRGYKEGFNAKDTIPYIICYEQGNTSSAGIAERAKHPDEVKSEDSRWLVDIDYYVAHQIHPVVSRLCAEIQGTSPERLAECLGLDPSKVKRQIDGFVSMYYKGIMMCDDESCKYTTRSPNFCLLGDCERGTVCRNYPNCNGSLLRTYTEADLYKQLSYFCHILDTQCSLDKMDVGVRIQVEKALVEIRPVVESAASVAQSIRDRCAYGWLQLTDIAI